MHSPQLLPARTPEPVTVSSFASFDELAPLADAWDALVVAAPRPSPYLLFPWVRTWWREYGGSSELAVHVAFRGDTPVGIVPAFVRRTGGVRVLRFLGDYRSMLADVLLAPGESVEVAHELLRAAQSRADYAALFGLGSDSNVHRAAGDSLAWHERNEAPVVFLDGDWDEIEREKFGRSSRSKHRAKRRKLSALGKLEVSIAATPAQIVGVTAESFRIHALRWRGRPDVSGTGTAQAKRFYAAAYRALAEERPGTFRVATLSLDRRVIAYHAHNVIDSRMYVHRLGFDPAFSRHSPGLLLILDVFERACREGITLVELLGPVESYKEPFADEFRPLYEALGGARTLRGRAALVAHDAAIRMRGQLKRQTRLRASYVSLRAAIVRARRT